MIPKRQFNVNSPRGADPGGLSPGPANPGRADPERCLACALACASKPHIVFQWQYHFRTWAVCLMSNNDRAPPAAGALRFWNTILLEIQFLSREHGLTLEEQRYCLLVAMSNALKK
jgi:hypothetical protein